MGVTYSMFPESRPNTVVLYVQNEGTCDDSSPSDWGSFPPVLQAANACNRDEWTQMVNKIEEEAPLFVGRRAKPIRYGSAALVLTVVTIIFLVSPRSVGVAFFLIFLAFLPSWAMSWYNQRQDVKIRQIIYPMQVKLSLVGINFQYETMYTGLCKPKRARTWRAFTITSMVNTVVQPVATAPGVYPMQVPLAQPAPGQPVLQQGGQQIPFPTQPTQYAAPSVQYNALSGQPVAQMACGVSLTPNMPQYYAQQYGEQPTQHVGGSVPVAQPAPVQY